MNTTKFKVHGYIPDGHDHEVKEKTLKVRGCGNCEKAGTTTGGVPLLFDRKQAAKILGVNVETLDRYRISGKLSYRKIGNRVLFAMSDLLAFSEACVVPATTLPTDREKRTMGGKV